MSQLRELIVLLAVIICCYAPATIAPCYGQQQVATKKKAQDSEKKSTRKIVHPGVAHSAADIEFARSMVKARKQPWLNAWSKLKSSGWSSLDYRPQPKEHVQRGPYNKPDIGSSEFSDDAKAAYAHAIVWAISQKEDHAKKAAEIVDAWSSTLKKMSNHDAQLLAGMDGYQFCVAAELLKHTWDGWSEKGQDDFKKIISDIWYPLVKDFHPTANGNWDASMLQLIIAMGVHTDDQEMIDHATNYFLMGKGNGAITHYFNEIGQCQESGRDQGHTQMGLDFLSNTCETARIQGIDLYGAAENRLLLGFEYTAKYNLGEDVPFERFRSYQGRYDYPDISDRARGRLRPTYEKVLRHYQYQLGIDAPYSERAVKHLRRRGGRRSRSKGAIDTLMFAVPEQADKPKKEKEALKGVDGPN